MFSDFLKFICIFLIIIVELKKGKNSSDLLDEQKIFLHRFPAFEFFCLKFSFVTILWKEKK